MLHFFRNLICVNLFLSLRILISFYFANVHCLYQSIHGRQLRFSFIICLSWNKLLAAVFFTSHDCPLFVQGKNFSLYIRRYDVLFHIDTKQALMNRIHSLACFIIVAISKQHFNCPTFKSFGRHQTACARCLLKQKPFILVPANKE